MSNGGEKAAEEQPSTKVRLTTQASFDEDNFDLDGFSELDKLEPTGELADQCQQPHFSQNQPSSMCGNPLQNGSLPNGPSAMVQPGPCSGGQPQQQSVLQELLLNSSSTSALNSPRQQQQPSFSSGSFPIKSPMPNSQTLPPMAAAFSQRNPMGQQQMRQLPSMAAQPVLEPGLNTQSGPVPSGFVHQGSGPPAMANQFSQPHRTPVFVSGQQARMPPSASAQQQTASGNIRQPAFVQQPSAQAAKSLRQQGPPHPGMLMPGGAPTPPAHGRPPMMAIGAPGQGSGNPFDPATQPYAHMIAGTINGGGGPPPQRQPPLSDANGYMVQSQGQLLGTTGAQPGQQMSPYINTQMVQQRAQPPMGFGPTGHQPMMSSMMAQMPNGPHLQQQGGLMANGAPLMGGPRPGGVGPPSAGQQQLQTQGLVPQSPVGMGNTSNGPGGQQQMRTQQPGGGGPGQMGPPVQQQPMGTAGQPQDPEKRKLIQQQLVLLLHAHKCQQRERQEPPQSKPACTLPYCNVMKGVLEHMVTCNSGRQCQYPHCASSRQIITHWKNCNKEDCPVCNPVKRYTNSAASTADRRQGEMMLSAHGLPFLPTSAHGQLAQAAGPSSAGMFGSPPSQSSTMNSLLDGYNPPANPFRSTNPPNKVGQGGGQLVPVGQHQMDPGGPGFVAPGQSIPPPEPPSQAKDWHASITPDLRNHLVGKLVKAIFPSPDPAALHDQRIRDLISYARKVEKDMFEAAQDKEAYYHLLAEKIYKIQKELQEKKNKRLNEQQHKEQPTDALGLREPKLEPRPEQAQMLNFVDSIPTKRPKLEETLDGCSTVPGPSNEIVVKQEPGTGALFLPVAENRRSSTPKDIKPSISAAAVPSEPFVREPKVFEANELRGQLMPILDKLWNTEESLAFRHPVDPIELGIPDYFDIIKNPMDLQTIRQNLDQGKYKNPWEFCDHMWLIFDNAWLYNRKNSKVHRLCTRLSEIFVEEVNPVMRQMGYCCGQKLSFTPLVQFCFGITKNNAACVIPRDQPYFMYESSSTGFGVTVAERYIYCVKCFENLPDEGINLNENTSEPANWIPKTMFQRMKNDQIDMEPFEQCQVCERKWHRICALHSAKINPEGFVCEQCRQAKTRPKPENKFTARKLPHCHLSRFIEDRVNGFLKQRLSEGDPEVEVAIRVLCSSDKEVEVKPQMLRKYSPEGYPDRFPYRSKAVFAFELLRDPETGISTEVCFFGLYVQEYGTNCAQPNQRRVYIAYLDSVHFFQPRTLRTSVYYEILLGYLQYVKQLGYTMAHIWACPPSEGDDYIFHCHPQEQKIPKPKRLQDWYKTMLNHGHEEGTVHSYKDIFNQAKDDGLDTPMKLPYFEGDYWPRIIDECISSAEKEEEQDSRRKQQEESSTLSDDDTFQTDDGMPVKKQQKASSSKKKNNLKKSAQNSKKKGGLSTGNPVVDRLFQQLDKHRDVFFTIRLFSAQEEQLVLSQKVRIEDPDPLISCELMDTRDNFLAKSREEHWEFSQLRRAKWSTLNFCYTLHTQEQEGKGLSYTCNECDKPACYHCNQCDDYDLCELCRNKVSHKHEMEKLLISEEQKSVDASSNASRNESVKKCITSLVHACMCRDANCRRGTCHKMKKVIMHTRNCKRRQSAGANCAVCKQLIALCCYHAKHCNSVKCQVPFCLQIRQKLQEQKRSQNRQAERMMQRRMMKLHSAAGALNGSGTANMGQPPSVQPGPSSSLGQPPHSPAHQLPVQQAQMFAVQQQHGQLQQQQLHAGTPGMGMMSQGAQQQMRLSNGPVGYQQMHGQQLPGGSAVQMINSSTMQPQMGGHQQPPIPGGGFQQLGGHQQPVQGGHMMQGMGGLQRVPSAGTMHAQQQQQQQSMGMVQMQSTPAGYVRLGQPVSFPPGSSQSGNIGQLKAFSAPQQRFPQAQQQMKVLGAQQEQSQQQYGGGGRGLSQQQQQQMKPNDIALICTRIKEASSVVEREAVFADLRKTPHLLNAFLKMCKNQGNNDFMQDIGGLGLGQSPQMRPPSQQQFMQPAGSTGQQFYQQGHMARGMPQPPPHHQQNGGTPQFNSLPPQHQWLQQHQQMPHPSHQPPQRNSS